MKLERKEAFSSGTDYYWKIEEIKTEKDAVDLIFRVSKLGKCFGFGFRGYDDMDEHGNEATFKTVEEVKKGWETIKKIDPDTVDTFVEVGDGRVSISINPFWDNEKGTFLSVFGPEKAAKKVSAAIKKMVEG